VASLGRLKDCPTIACIPELVAHPLSLGHARSLKFSEGRGARQARHENGHRERRSPLQTWRPALRRPSGARPCRLPGGLHSNGTKEPAI
jgi:hypothetical protein